VTELVQALLAPGAYPHHPARVEMAQTQMSFVFLTGDLVYKVKKPVDLGYLDYTTLEKRHFFCQQEVELNRRLAPGIYLGVVPVVRRGGQVLVEGEGEVLEYAVKMRQLPRERTLDMLLSQNQVTEEMVKQVAQKLARFHEKAHTSPQIAAFGSLDIVLKNVEENFSQTKEYIGRTISEEGYGAIKDYTYSFIEKSRRLFERRVAGSRIRDCHGDLHAAHVCFSDDIYIFDCIEFNERFRYTDVASEVAFLAMDLDFHSRPDLSRAFVQAYTEYSGDQGLARLLDFYKVYRAYVRGKVEGFKSDDPHIGEEERAKVLASARRYFELAESYI
jgi:hypothetical protein